MNMKEEGEKEPFRVTDIDALKDNVKEAVAAFNERWISMPALTLDTEVMDQRQLRDAMGLRATFDAGDPWPQAEKLLLKLGFRWHWLGSQRVMFLQEKDDFVNIDGNADWEEADEV